MKFIDRIVGLFDYVNGWKTIIGYAIAQIAGSYPLVAGAFAAWKLAPHDPQAIANLIAQLTLVGGVGHKVIKNLQGLLKSNPLS